jgi:hypothetical protein
MLPQRRREESDIESEQGQDRDDMAGDQPVEGEGLDCLIERARSDPEFFHALVFHPNKIANELSRYRRAAAAAAFGINPNEILARVAYGTRAASFSGNVPPRGLVCVDTVIWGGGGGSGGGGVGTVCFT